MAEDPLLPSATPPELMHLIGSYLANRRWYAADAPPSSLGVLDSGCLAELDGSARFLWAIVMADGSPYQLVIAERPTADSAGHLHGHENALVGTVGDRVYYDASLDSEMAVALLRAASGGPEKPSGAAHWQPSSPTPRSSTTTALSSNCSAVSLRGQTPTSKYRRRWPARGSDMWPCPWSGGNGMGTTWPSGSSTWPAARTGGPWPSRPCVTSTAPPVRRPHHHSRHVGGDFAAEAARLGQMTADMHLAMAEAFGSSSGGFAEHWSALIASIRERVLQLGSELSASAQPLLARLDEVRDPGPRIPGSRRLPPGSGDAD